MAATAKEAITDVLKFRFPAFIPSPNLNPSSTASEFRPIGSKVFHQALHCPLIQIPDQRDRQRQHMQVVIQIDDGVV